jgi:hypothetical protein
MVRRALVSAALAALAIAAPASAATYVARPTSTLFSAWTTAPLGADLYSVLDDPVARPATPTIAGDEAHTDKAGVWSARVRVAAPSIPASETPTAARLAVYAEVGPPSTLTVTMYSGLLPLRTLMLAAGTKPGWYASADVALNGSVPGDLQLSFDDVRGSGPGPTRVSAASIEVDTRSAAAAAGPADAPAATPVGDDTPADGDQPSSPAGNGDGDGPPAAQLVTPATIALAPAASAVPFALGCPAGAASACRGTIVLQVAGAAPPKRGRARAARCARGCRTIGQASFQVAAGKKKKVKVKIAHAARNLFARGRTVHATAVVTTRDAAGSTTVVRHPVSIRRSG